MTVHGQRVSRYWDTSQLWAPQAEHSGVMSAGCRLTMALAKVERLCGKVHERFGSEAVTLLATVARSGEKTQRQRRNDNEQDRAGHRDT